MKYCGRMLVCGLVAVAVNAGAIVSVSDAKGSPYRAIERRNLFGLLLPVNSRTEPNTPVISRPKVTLVGITTLLGYRTAFLMLPASKGGGVRECLLLREGEMQEEIQVRKIGDNAVKVVNHGEDQTLSFENPAVPAGVPVPIDGPIDQTSPMQTSAPEKPLTSEQQLLVIEAQRLKAIQDEDPVAKILPPTEMTAGITGEAP